MKPDRLPPVHLTEALLLRFPELTSQAPGINRLRDRFAELEFPPLKMGLQDYRGIAWRCQAIVAANLIRAEELLHFAILALNERAIITATILARGLEETVAAVVFARRKMERVRKTKDPNKIATALDRLTCGNRYLSQRRDDRPAPYGVMSMIDEADAHFREQHPEKLNKSSAILRNHYEAISEAVHPSQSSFGMYQIRVGDEMFFTRTAAERAELLPDLLTAIGMSCELLLEEAPRLCEVTDL